ncbi:ATP-grasp domain-containing protein [Algibacillus agarilyticus]|uniref:ATP-grasp domain-containing protein n=1 Tax=Algibacillus agarilyticus TaxID=2234133 RepID=UPI000DD05B5C|nr:ATP-grasp domain-containing protein [Algibacillus agarilyticus]
MAIKKQITDEYTGIVQKYLTGQVGTYSFCAHQGRFLAGVAAKQLESFNHPFEQATVLQSVVIPELDIYAAKLCKHLNYTGFGGIDFIIQNNGLIQVLEVNARMTKLAQMGMHYGVNLLAIFFDTMAGRAPQYFQLEPHKIVAVFPHESARDRQSQYLKHTVDMPWQEPQMLKMMLNKIVP